MDIWKIINPPLLTSSDRANDIPDLDIISYPNGTMQEVGTNNSTGTDLRMDCVSSLEHSYMNHCNALYSVAPRQQNPETYYYYSGQNSPDTTQEGYSTEDIHLFISVHNAAGVWQTHERAEYTPITTYVNSDSTVVENSGGTSRSSVVDSTTMATFTGRVLHLELPEEYSRRSIIRDGLLCQGFSESAITTYFKQYTESTN
ncbi:hypothetical protein GGI08_008293, partial [Coemansia sp. S2]